MVLAMVADMNETTDKASTSPQGFVLIYLTHVLKTRDCIPDITKNFEKKSSKLQVDVFQATSSVHKPSNQVLDMMVSMQFQDIARQRLGRVRSTSRTTGYLHVVRRREREAR